jgi:hypothetical protein
VNVFAVVVGVEVQRFAAEDGGNAQFDLRQVTGKQDASLPSRMPALLEGLGVRLMWTVLAGNAALDSAARARVFTLDVGGYEEPGRVREPNVRIELEAGLRVLNLKALCGKH